MPNINKLEEQASESWEKAKIKEREYKDKMMVPEAEYSALFLQNKALYYQQQIIIENQKEILKYLKQNE